MRQLLRLLLYLAAGTVLYAPCALTSYFESAPTCGYEQQDFVHFEQSPELIKEPSNGVCGWGFDGIPQLQPRLDLCTSCYFTSADRPTCRRGHFAVRSPEWHLAQLRDCAWQGCYLSDGTCTNGTAESTAVCENGSANLNCCPFKRFVRCCSMLSCTLRSSPVGKCVVGEKDLLPGQQFVGRSFAVNIASTDCYSYSFATTRICQPDRTFGNEGGVLYDTCETLPAIGRDTDGCAKLAGYTFHQGWLLADAATWRMDDGTQWGKLANPAEAQRAAALDMPLMASRCSASGSCAAFQNTGNSTDLLYQLPTSQYWVKVDSSDESARCFGIYERLPPPTSCSRVPGYLFIPLYTLDTAGSSEFAAPSGAGPCANCGDASALALQCEAYGSDGACAGFSNYHGLLTGSAGLLSDQPLSQFTSTPCVGMFVRAGKVFPHEVEQLDQLLCGERVYCTSQLRYHASGQSATASSGGSYYVDLQVDFLTDYEVPTRLLDPSGSGLRQMPSVRSLVLRCHYGSTLVGGLPLALVALMPFLQELRVAGCGLSGGLPVELARLRYLRVLDLSLNRFTGPLPGAWANMSLGYLNLSSNQLSGSLPTSWRGILTPQPAAPPPPPPPPYTQIIAPPPPASAVVSNALQAQWGLMVADLSANALSGPVDREYVYDSCVDGDVRLQLRGAPPSELLAALGQGGSPTYLLHDNAGVAAWAEGYRYAVADLSGGMSGGSSNLCGAYQYKIALGVVWGVFGLCLLAIITWSAATAWRNHRAAKRSQFIISDAIEPAEDTAGTDDAAGAETAAAVGGFAARCRVLASRLRSWTGRLWAKRWFRRVALLVRVSYLAVDVALDIWVTVWLFQDGDTTSAAVCLAFVVATQAAIGVALVANLAHHFFASKLWALAVAPLLVGLSPVLGPVMAAGNLQNSDVPLVFWRYLELVEFCVALLQAPAESVTQSIVYARQNLMGNGMYMSHGLFLASIILSLGDIIIAAIKLCRYKRGPLRRILVAVTHLDRVRDPVDYRQRLLSVTDSGGKFGDGTTAFGFEAAGPAHYLETPLNPPPSASAGGAGSSAASRMGSAGGTEAEGGAYAAPDDVQAADAPVEGAPMGATAAAAAVTAAASAAAAAAVSHTFTPLTAPRYRPSLLATSSQRLGGGSMGGSSHSLYSTATNVPSRLGPAGGARHSSITIPAQPSLRPLMGSPSLPSNFPATSTAGPRRTSTGADTADAPGPSSSIAQRSTSAAGASGSLSSAWAAAVAAEQQSDSDRDTGGGRSSSLSRRSRSLQGAVPPLPADSSTLVSSISSDVYGLAATGGHGPPPGQPLSPVVESPGATGASGRFGDDGTDGGGGGFGVPPSVSRRASGGGSLPALSRSGSTAGPRPSATTASWPPPPPPIFPPISPGAADGRYFASVAAAAAAAMEEDERAAAAAAAGPSGRPAFNPARVSAGPSLLTSAGSLPMGGAAGVSALRRAPSALADTRSANVSPARGRREAPALSIAVPASPVGGQGIEVIRISTPASLGPMTSGAPTPVGWLPPPPQSQEMERQGEPSRGPVGEG